MACLQPIDVGDDLMMTRLNAAVVCVSRGMAVCRHGLGVVKKQTHIFMERALIALQRQRIIAARASNGFGGVALAMHCIKGHDTALQGQQFQQLGNGGDLVRFAVEGLTRRNPSRRAMIRSLNPK